MLSNCGQSTVPATNKATEAGHHVTCVPGDSIRSYTANGRQERGAGHCQSVGGTCGAMASAAGPFPAPAPPARLFQNAVKEVAKPWQPRLRIQAPEIQPVEAALDDGPRPVESTPSESLEKTSSTPVRARSACPRQDDVTVGADMGLISPFSVGYACSQIGDRQPDGRAANVLLSRVWQEVKVNADDEVCYLGHEGPIVAFRAQTADGLEQLFTTEPWKLYCLQRAAVARTSLKAIIMPRFILDAAVIESMLATLQIPEDFNRICIASPDGAEQHFSWEKRNGSKTAHP